MAGAEDEVVRGVTVVARGDSKFCLDSISHFDEGGADETCDFFWDASGTIQQYSRGRVSFGRSKRLHRSPS